MLHASGGSDYGGHGSTVRSSDQDAVLRFIDHGEGRLMTDDSRSETTFDLVKTLTELPGPTGHEDAVQAWIETRWGSFCSEVRRTRVGNVLARVGGEGERCLFLAHA